MKIKFAAKEGGAGLKIKLSVRQARFQEIQQALLEHGIEIDESADLVLSDAVHSIDSLLVKDVDTNERICLPVHEIVSIESFGHTVEVYTEDKVYQAKERLYKIESLLDPDKFLRISNSVVIAANQVKSISPTLSMKFILTLQNGKKVDVTRSYYYIFKEFFGI